MAATKDLTQGDIKKMIVHLTLPMILGMFGLGGVQFC